MKKFPHTFIIIFSLIVICAVATWFVQGGEYVEISGGSGLVYEQVEAQPQTWQVFTALYKGFEKQAGIIVFILIIGGAFWVVNASKAVDVGIRSFLSWTKRIEDYPIMRKIGVNNVIMTLIMVIFSVFGGVFGMSEEAIVFVAIIVPLAVSMGYDSITGLCLVYVAAHVGFAGAFLNPFTIGVAQNMAGLPLFSGMEYRFVCWLLLTAILIVFVLRYAAKVKKNPQKSIMYEADGYWRDKLINDSKEEEPYRNRASWIVAAIIFTILVLFMIFYSKDCSITIGNGTFRTVWLLPATTILFGLSSFFACRRSVHFFILNLLGFTILYLIIGVLAFDWYIPEISALFLALGISSGIAAGFGGNTLVKEFLSGVKDILSAALVVGLAAGIIIVLEDGKIIDTILNSLANGLKDAGQMASLSIMYGIQTLINLFIPSATAKAAITIPIMAPFSDLIGLSRQATVLAFQFGDGFTNMITPTSGVLMAALGMARIPYTKWVKWVWKSIIALVILGFILLIPPILLNLSGF